MSLILLFLPKDLIDLSIGSGEEIALLNMGKKTINKNILSFGQVHKLIKKVVSTFYFKYKIPLKEREDIEQEIVQKYLIRKDKIEQSFRGNSKYETYLTSIFYKMCCEVIRSEQKNWHLHEHNDSDMINLTAHKINEDNIMVIKSEIEYLRILHELFDDEKIKIIIFQKHLFQLMILLGEIKKYHPDYQELSLDKILLKIAESKTEAFENLSKVVNLVENKDIKPDAVRIWLYGKIDFIIKVMNNSYHKTNYRRDSYQLLFEYTFSQNKN